MSAFDFLYASHDRPIRSLGAHYKPPATFRHGEDELVAEIEKPENGDGYHVRVYECRMPARFYKVVALAGKNSTNEERAGFSLTTGSGDESADLAGRIALALAQGMLSLHVAHVPEAGS